MSGHGQRVNRLLRTRIARLLGDDVVASIKYDNRTADLAHRFDLWMARQTPRRRERLLADLDFQDELLWMDIRLDDEIRLARLKAEWERKYK